QLRQRPAAQRAFLPVAADVAAHPLYLDRREQRSRGRELFREDLRVAPAEVLEAPDADFAQRRRSAGADLENARQVALPAPAARGRRSNRSGAHAWQRRERDEFASPPSCG